MNEKFRNKITDLERNETHLKQQEVKHYNRFKGFLTYDIEEREIDEQILILEQVQKVSADMLDELRKTEK